MKPTSDAMNSMFKVVTSGYGAADISTVMALAVAKKEKNYIVNVISEKLTELSVSSSDSIDDLLARMRKFAFGGTDCALPMLHATKNKIEGVDKFVIYTDNETWFGKVHPSRALADYRKKFNPNAKLIVAATSATEFSIANQNDGGMLDIVGFDASSPALIQGF